MLARRTGWRPAALLMGGIVVVIATGCASSSIQTGAQSFLDEHAASAVAAAAAGREAEADVLSLARPPSRAALAQLAHRAALARRAFLPASEWSVGERSEGGEEAVEEEDLPRAETEATEAADRLVKAMAALLAYARKPLAARLALYMSTFSRGREQWNESLTQLWFLAHRSHPPLL